MKDLFFFLLNNTYTYLDNQKLIYKLLSFVLEMWEKWINFQFNNFKSLNLITCEIQLLYLTQKVYICKIKILFIFLLFYDLRYIMYRIKALHGWIIFFSYWEWNKSLRIKWNNIFPLQLVNWFFFLFFIS